MDANKNITSVCYYHWALIRYVQHWKLRFTRSAQEEILDVANFFNIIYVYNEESACFLFNLKVLTEFNWKKLDVLAADFFSIFIEKSTGFPFKYK